MDSNITISIEPWMLAAAYGAFKVGIATYLQGFYTSKNEGTFHFKPFRFFLWSVLKEPETTIVKAILAPFAFVYCLVIHRSLVGFSWRGILPSVMQPEDSNPDEFPRRAVEAARTQTEQPKVSTPSGILPSKYALDKYARISYDKFGLHNRYINKYIYLNEDIDKNKKYRF